MLGGLRRSLARRLERPESLQMSQVLDRPFKTSRPRGARARDAVTSEAEPSSSMLAGPRRSLARSLDRLKSEYLSQVLERGADLPYPQTLGACGGTGGRRGRPEALDGRNGDANVAWSRTSREPGAVQSTGSIRFVKSASVDPGHERCRA